MNLNILSNITSNAVENNKNLQGSLSKLSSGMKITKASDDASGLAISDKLRTQASSVKQGIDNANSAVAMLQIADKAMSELSNILDIIKSKAIQMSTQTTSEEGKKSIKSEILKLISNYQSIVCGTSYNSIPLLSGCASTFEFHMGSFANDIITAKIDSISARNMGKEDPFKLSQFINGFQDFPAGNIGNTIGSGGSGVVLNNDLSQLTTYSSSAGGRYMITVPSGISNLTLYLDEMSQDDTLQVFTKSGKHIAGTPNTDFSWETGYAPSNIVANNLGTYFNVNAVYSDELSSPSIPNTYYGPYNSVDRNSNTPTSTVVASYIDKDGVVQTKNISEHEELVVVPNVTEDLVVFVNGTGSYHVSAEWSEVENTNNSVDPSCECPTIPSRDDTDLTSQAKILMSVVDEALNQLNSIRGEVGSSQNQLEAATRNMMTEYTNIKAAESVIRDVDYAGESANFNRENIISQAGTFTQSQANETMQNVLKLLK